MFDKITIIKMCEAASFAEDAQNGLLFMFTFVLFLPKISHVHF